jgi:hypothetical protein
MRIASGAGGSRPRDIIKRVKYVRRKSSERARKDEMTARSLVAASRQITKERPKRTLRFSRDRDLWNLSNLLSLSLSSGHLLDMFCVCRRVGGNDDGVSREAQNVERKGKDGDGVNGWKMDQLVPRYRRSEVCGVLAM